jgi:RimJ/RimL family protein N-acetyltransferase
MTAAGVIRTARLDLHRWDDRFEADFVRHATDPRVTRYIGDGSPWTAERAAARFAGMRDHWTEHGYGWRPMVVRETGAYVGFAALNAVDAGSGITDPRPSDVEIGRWLLPEASGFGYATEGARAVLDEAFGRLAAGRVVARIGPANTASQHVAERIGLRRYAESLGPYGQPILLYAVRRTPETRPHDDQLPG